MLQQWRRSCPFTRIADVGAGFAAVVVSAASTAGKSFAVAFNEPVCDDEMECERTELYGRARPSAASISKKPSASLVLVCLTLTVYQSPRNCSGRVKFAQDNISVNNAVLVVALLFVLATWYLTVGIARKELPCALRCPRHLFSTSYRNLILSYYIVLYSAVLSS